MRARIWEHRRSEVLLNLFAVYHVLSESGVYSRLDVAQTRGLTPLVGRAQEVSLLLERWKQVKDGQGHVVLLTGDAGIGKSRLVQMLKDHVANEPHTRWECRSSEYYQNTALFPLTDLFQRIWRFEAHETPEAKVEQLEHALSQYRLPVEESVPLFAPLFSLSISENRYPPLALSPQRQRQKTLETLVAILQEHTEHHPVLFIVEDLHWTDPTTLELLNLVIDQTPTASLLVLLTCRPTFQPSWHHRSYITEMTLHRLSPIPGGTDRDTHHRWKSLTNRGAPTDYYQDGWRPVICRGNDQSDSRIRTTQSHSMGTTNLQGFYPHSPFQRPCTIP